MYRRVILATLIGTFIAGLADLDACGDKFLRVGRSPRFRGAYAAVHPASILIYSPTTASRDGVKALETMLKRAGHRPQTVKAGTPIQPAITGQFDLVIAAYVDVDRVQRELSSLPARPEVLPILYNVTNDTATEAAREYRHLLKPDAMNKAEALAEIDALMEARRHGTVGGR